MGTVLFMFNAWATSGLTSAAIKPQNIGLFYGLVVVPDIVASCTFVIAGWLSMVEASHHWWGGLSVRQLGWWSATMNMLGGVGFLVNAVLYYQQPESFASTVALVVGSALFLGGSYTAWVEQCVSSK